MKVLAHPKMVKLYILSAVLCINFNFVLLGCIPVILFILYNKIWKQGCCNMPDIQRWKGNDNFNTNDFVHYISIPKNTDTCADMTAVI